MNEIIEENKITEIIIGSAIKVHKELGPGLLESSYKECLFYELNKAGLLTEKEKPLPLIYEEVKSVDALNDIHLAQLLTYLKLSNCKVGLLINFNVLKLTSGLKRVVNNY